MQTEETILLSENPEWRLVLQTYFQAEQELPAPSRSESAKAKAAAAEAVAPSSEVPEAENAEHEKSAVGWLPRLRAVAGVASELLSSIHGGLIAAGLLRFELFGRDGDGIHGRVRLLLTQRLKVNAGSRGRGVARTSLAYLVLRPDAA